MRLFNNKTLLITGGTGSFGNAVLKKFLSLGLKEIRIFSRDEKKQDDMRKLYRNENLKFYIGDVRDKDAISNAMKEVDYVFHAAALKQVPSCEFYPLEAMKTNVQGTENVLETAINLNVKKVICLSTDKAVYPINAMGISKALMEKVAVAKSRSSAETVICITRYGNVMGSRGSVIPLFINQLSKGIPFTVTDPNMTRFMMTLGDAIDLVLFAFENGKNGDLFVQKSPASSLKTLIEAIVKVYDYENVGCNIIGTRHGEKLFEVLLSREEVAVAEDLGKYFRVPPDIRDLNYGSYTEIGEAKITSSEDYNSHNTDQLDVSLMSKLLKRMSLENNL